MKETIDKIFHQVQKIFHELSKNIIMLWIFFSKKCQNFFDSSIKYCITYIILRFFVMKFFDIIQNAMIRFLTKLKCCFMNLSSYISQSLNRIVRRCVVFLSFNWRVVCSSSTSCIFREFSFNLAMKIWNFLNQVCLMSSLYRRSVKIILLFKLNVFF